MFDRSFTLNKIDKLSLPPITLGGVSLEYSRRVRNLGIILNENLTWDDHVAVVSRRVFGVIHKLYRCGKYFSTDTRKTLARALVLPHFEYGNIIYCNLSFNLRKLLHRAQNSAVRFVYKVGKRDRLTPLYRKLGWLKLDEVRELRLMVFFYKILFHTKSPPYICELFTRPRRSVGAITRFSITKFRHPPIHTNYYKNSLTPKFISKFNSLPASFYTRPDGTFISLLAFKLRYTAKIGCS